MLPHLHTQTTCTMPHFDPWCLDIDIIVQLARGLPVKEPSKSWEREAKWGIRGKMRHLRRNEASREGGEMRHLSAFLGLFCEREAEMPHFASDASFCLTPMPHFASLSQLFEGSFTGRPVDVRHTDNLHDASVRERQNEASRERGLSLTLASCKLSVCLTSTCLCLTSTTCTMWWCETQTTYMMSMWDTHTASCLCLISASCLCVSHRHVCVSHRQLSRCDDVRHRQHTRCRCETHRQQVVCVSYRQVGCVSHIDIVHVVCVSHHDIVQVVDVRHRQLARCRCETHRQLADVRQRQLARCLILPLSQLF